ncbi:acetate uptake transporter [Phaeovibrio sulfidiphilus]|uniref:Acetate uptake transporter n=1 Tax=Phaeovibrio sulfidiphilus TaxID=1220600 RepID=A0A8J6YLY2_9PROT|nr:acetate uptake transporter [Phaeovibrio sulfidiphilus]MBE1236234.1 acetate uptake transporter [Phaeovibrio sulfidiphilus]
MGENQDRKVQIVVADPSALGLLGLTVVTAVAASQKLGVTQGLSFVIVWAIFLGAVAQLAASMYDFNHNNLFGAIVFGAFGLFWLGVSSCWAISLGAFGPELAASVDPRQMGFAFLVFLVFALAGTVIASELNKVLFIDMMVIDVLLFALTVNALGFGGTWAGPLAAWSEVGVSAISLYACCGAFLNKFYGRSILPMGAPPSLLGR